MQRDSKIQNTTVALMNTGAHLWRKCIKFSSAKIWGKKVMVVLQFGARNRNRPSKKCSVIQNTEHYSRLDEHWCPLVAEMRKIFKPENLEKKVMVVIQFGARNRNRPSKKCGVIQKVQNTTVALMNTGAYLWWKCVQFSRPKIGKIMVVLQFGAYRLFMW
jgi:hypothetical protein